MKNLLNILVTVSLVGSILTGCQQSGAGTLKTSPEKGMVSGKATDAKGNSLPNVKIELSHTVWSDKKMYAQTDDNGFYKVTIPAEPRGNWTIQARHETTAYGQDYAFVLDANDNSSFGGVRGATRDFTWKLLGEHIGGRYGGQVEVRSVRSTIPLADVKLIFSPAEELLVDGSEAKTLEQQLGNVNGKFITGFVPVGKYLVQAVYKGKPLNISSTGNGTTQKEAAIVFSQDQSSHQPRLSAQLFIEE